MRTRYGRSKGGQLCRAPIPHGHLKTTTLVAAFALEGIVAPMVLDGAIDGEPCLRGKPRDGGQRCDI